jgi:hypothetical protein
MNCAFMWLFTGCHFKEPVNISLSVPKCPLDPILTHISPFCIFTVSFSRAHYYIFFASTIKSSKWSISLRSPDQHYKMVFTLLSLFWKNKSRLMRPPLCLCVCVSPPINFWTSEPVIRKLSTCIMAPEPISTAYFINPSHQSVCLYVSPPFLC